MALWSITFFCLKKCVLNQIMFFRIIFQIYYRCIVHFCTAYTAYNRREEENQHLSDNIPRKDIE